MFDYYYVNLCHIGYTHFFFFKGTSTTWFDTYCHTLSLHDALPFYCSPWSDSLCRQSRAITRKASRTGMARCSGIGSLPGIGLRSLGFALTAEMLRQCNGCGPMERVHQYVSPKGRSEEHTSEIQSLMRISYAVFCLKKKKTKTEQHTTVP